MQELVSIIVPVYNVEKYVDACIGSIINQTYKKLEIIIVNDGSTDSSADIIDKYKAIDSRIKVIDKINEGLSIARQTGIDCCTGKYFSTIDSDDFVESRYVEYMVAELEKNGADIALCAKTIFDDSGKHEEENLHNSVKPILHVTREILEKEYTNLCNIYQMSDSWNKMYRTDFVKKTSVRFCLPKQFNGTDLLFNHSLLLHEPVLVSVNIPLYNYRLTNNSRVRRKDKHLEVGFRMIYDYLLKENAKICDSKSMRSQIGAEYIILIKYATLDYYEEHKDESKKTLLHGFKQICDTMPSFTFKEITNYANLVPKSISFFTILIMLHNSLGVYLYYSFRNMLRRKHN